MQRSLNRFRNYVRSASFFKTREWQRLRREVMEAADYRCQGDGCKEREGLNAHHLISRFEDPDKALDRQNLIVLCSRCHSAYHHWTKGYSLFSSASPANDAQYELFDESA